ncbi:MAG: LamG-like jellyroll fold domain-containing protein [Candidatus Thermoplasmatota archaeon]|nr:LamG-like jellyroll fold domain-containing protein [Candidatus Thermoplasmatota archaeon]
MQKHNFVNSNHAVSELVGGLILITIAIMVFSSIYMYVFPLPLPSAEANVQLVGYVDSTGNAVIKHMGGEPLDTYRVDVKHVNGTLIDSTVYKNKWTIGDEYSDIPTLSNETDKVRVIIYITKDDGSEEVVFDGILSGKASGELSTYNSSGDPYLISSLLTNTTDEDLICFNKTKNGEPINSTINATTYIYNWMVGGNPITTILMPFDTESEISTKDYSDNGYNGTICGATWTNNGRVGGAYYFGGASDYISMDMPNVFEDISNNDFTICLWIKSDDTTDDWRVVSMACKDNKNFVKFFQYGTEIHFGLCEDGVKRAVRTENLSNNIWYHIAGVWDASKKSLSIYINGLSSEEIGNRNYAMGSGEGSVDIGHGSSSSRFWYGYVDEFEIYDRALSTDQIYQIYISTKDGDSDKRIVVSEETILGDVWQCIVTPNDGTQDGTSIESNILNIVSYGGD